MRDCKNKTHLYDLFQTMKEHHAGDRNIRALKSRKKNLESQMKWKREYKSGLLLKFIAEDGHPTIIAGMEKVIMKAMSCC